MALQLVLRPCCIVAPGFEYMVSPWLNYEAYAINVRAARRLHAGQRLAIKRPAAASWECQSLTHQRLRGSKGSLAACPAMLLFSNAQNETAILRVCWPAIPRW